MRVMLLMVVTSFLILRHSDDSHIFGEGIVTPPISDFECPRKTICVHLIIGWCEHPPSTFTGESQCRAQNPIFASLHSIIRLLNSTRLTIFQKVFKILYRRGGYYRIFWRGVVTPSRLRIPSAKPYPHTYIIYFLNIAPRIHIKCLQDTEWVTPSTFSGANS